MLSAALVLAAALAAPAAPPPAAAPAGRAPAAEAPAPADPRLDVLAAMTAELARSSERLKLAGHEAPYFVSYQVKEVAKNEIEGRYGAVFDDATKRDRNLFVDVRVGTYELDSSGPEQLVIVLDGGDGPTWYAPKDAPLDGDAPALRNALWLATDERYKEALSNYYKRRSRDVYRDAEQGPRPELHARGAGSSRGSPVARAVRPRALARRGSPARRRRSSARTLRSSTRP